MPHQPAGSPAKSNSSSEKTATPCPKKNVSFDYSAAIITSSVVVPTNLYEKLWDAILTNDIKKLKLIVTSTEFSRGLIASYVDKKFNAKYWGHTALTLATVLGRTKMVEILAKASGFIDDTNVNGDTALHVAVNNHDYKTALVLLQNNANYKVLNKKNLDALMLAYKLRLCSKGKKIHLITWQIETLIRNHSYQYGELKFELNIVTAAERNQRVKELQDQKQNPTHYLSTVYVK